MIRDFAIRRQIRLHLLVSASRSVHFCFEKMYFVKLKFQRYSQIVFLFTALYRTGMCMKSTRRGRDQTDPLILR